MRGGGLPANTFTIGKMRHVGQLRTSKYFAAEVKIPWLSKVSLRFLIEVYSPPHGQVGLIILFPCLSVAMLPFRMPSISPTVLLNSSDMLAQNSYKVDLNLSRAFFWIQRSGSVRFGSERAQMVDENPESRCKVMPTCCMYVLCT